jgi:hypothetical protein
MQIAHLLELSGRAVGEVPSATRREVLNNFRFAQTMRAPDADWRTTPPDSGDLIVTLKNVV